MSRIASHRAYAPERSTSASSALPAASTKSPACSQLQPFFDAPSVAPRRPFTSSVNVPGENSGSQSFVRAHARHVPARGIVTSVRAGLAVGRSAPGQIRYALPILWVNWVSTSQLP